MAKIQLKNVKKQYEDGYEAVKDFSIDIEDKEFLIVVGPSGCGKSTILRMIAGLETITSGELLIDGKRMNEVEPCDRDIAMVFQNYALYPHMTVRKNIAYSLKVKKEKKQVIKEKVMEAAKILGLEQVLDRKPGQLSGGQKQRVAMGRAIVRNPKVFLMDEPLSNLDAKLRGQMRVEIASLYQKLDTTFIYVTHDQTEAMTLGTRIVVMKDGVIQQIDTPQRLYNNPVNQFVAGFIGMPSMNFLSGRCVDAPQGLCIDFGNYQVRLTEQKERALRRGHYVNEEVVVGIRPEDIQIVRDPFVRAHYEGQVSVYEMLGAESMIYLVNGKNQITVKAGPLEKAESGQNMRLAFTEEKLHIFDHMTGMTITN